MLDNITLGNILFLDIETTPQYASFEDIPEKLQKLWIKKAAFLSKENELPEDLYPRAGIYAEFGKIICISVGYFKKENNILQFRIKSFYGDDEKNILSGFTALVERYFNNKEKHLCAHNGKEFDFPYIIRRLLINGMILPNILDIAGKKPWETPFLDTMELWKFGDYKSYTSLDLLATIFDIPTPKDDIDGSDVWWVYWKEKDLERIVKYCQKDVFTTAQLLLRYKGESFPEPGQIIYV